MDIISKFAKKPKILCLHGHAASAKILEAELQVWPEFVLEKMDLIFIDAPFPVEEQTSLFGPPYFEWFHYNQVTFSFSLSFFSDLIFVHLDKKNLYDEVSNFVLHSY